MLHNQLKLWASIIIKGSVFIRMTTNGVLKERTCAIIVIGDEVLKGYTKDCNSHFLCTRLYNLGISVKKISVIPDCVDVIADEVSTLSQSFAFVITSGGVGPTHDDVTYEGVAKAFQEPLQLNEEMAEIIKKHFCKPDTNSSPAFKMAKIPKSAQLLYGKTHDGYQAFYPVVQVRNVIIFPGIPRLLTKGFQMLEEQLFGSSVSHHQNIYKRIFYVNVGEVALADQMTKVAGKFHGIVNLGSYPTLHNPGSYYKVQIVLDSKKESSLDDAASQLMSSLPKEALVQYDPVPWEDAYKKLGAYLNCLKASSVDADKILVLRIESSIALIEEALNKYGLSGLCLSFNGGKDCQVLLHLLHCILSKNNSYQFNENMSLKAIHVRPTEPFMELEQFVQDAATWYNLTLVSLSGDIKQALSSLKSWHPEIAAVIMGTRCTDPFSMHLAAFSQTDSGWPEYMRVLPLLEWSYGEIWRFLRELWLPYCQLYDLGYTSIGNMRNTLKNPSLQCVDGTGNRQYFPAYMLKDEHQERAGRV